MTLGDLIASLEDFPDHTEIPIEFSEPHSWRGIYEDLAFVAKPKVSTIGDFRKLAESCLGMTIEGYKGGDYTVSEWTDIHISNYGVSTDYVWYWLIRLMTQH